MTNKHINFVVRLYVCLLCVEPFGEINSIVYCEMMFIFIDHDKMRLFAQPSVSQRPRLEFFVYYSCFEVMFKIDLLSLVACPSGSALV